jgi:Rieske Fe-S protein
MECEVCGNTYERAFFQVVMAGKVHTFDSFECASRALAPTCDHCGCKIIGHGMEADGVFYCCAHCAAERGIGEMKEHI